MIAALLLSTPLIAEGLEGVNPCHAGASRSAAPCGELQFPRGLCSSCRLKPDAYYGKTEIEAINGQEDQSCDSYHAELMATAPAYVAHKAGEFKDCAAMFDVATDGCLAELQKYVDDNVCDDKRRDFLSIVKNGPNHPNYATAVEGLDFFVYAMCEACCDCIPFGGHRDDSSQYNIHRGNCYAHPRFDTCSLFPNLTWIGPNKPPNAAPVCPALEDFEAGPGRNFLLQEYQHEFEEPRYRIIPPFLESMWNGLHCSAVGAYQQCFDLECAQNRIRSLNGIPTPKPTRSPDIHGTPTPKPTLSPELHGDSPGEAGSEQAIGVLESRLHANTDLSDGSGGRCTLEVTPNGDIQTSTYSDHSFILENVGTKSLRAFFLDVSDAIIGDSVFDPDGTAGDTIAKPLTINTNTGFATKYFDILSPFELPGDTPIPAEGGKGGYRGLVIEFHTHTPNLGSVLTWALDMDPNSIANTAKHDVDVGYEGWDVGGVSGAELIGSEFYCVFDDSTVAKGYLGSNHGRSGSHGMADQDQREETIEILVTTGAGVFSSRGSSAGWFGGDKPAIKVRGPPHSNVRVSLAKAFQPTTNWGLAGRIQQRLNNAQPAFPVNNYYDIAHFDVTLGQDGETCLQGFGGEWNDIPPSEGFSPDTYMAVFGALIDVAGRPRGPVEKVYLHPNGVPVASHSPQRSCGGTSPSAAPSAPSTAPSSQPSRKPSAPPAGQSNPTATPSTPVSRPNVQACPAGGPKNSVTSGSLTIDYFADFYTWPAARACCMARGGDLLVVSSETINQLAQGVQDHYNDRLHAWIGIEYTSSGGYRWVDGTPVGAASRSFENWIAGEPPIPGSGRGAVVRWTRGGVWVSVSKNDPRRFLCMTGSDDGNGDGGTTPDDDDDGGEDGDDDGETPPECPAGGPQNSMSTGGQTLEYYDEFYTWTAARACCLARGGDLAIIASNAMNQIAQHIQLHQGPNHAWIGIEYTGGAYKWVDGTTVGSASRPYTQWGFSNDGAHEPPQNGVGRGAVSRYFSGRWVTVDKAEKRRFLCLMD